MHSNDRKSKEKLKSLLIKMKEECEKTWLKTHHSKKDDHGMVPPFHSK